MLKCDAIEHETPGINLIKIVHSSGLGSNGFESTLIFAVHSNTINVKSSRIFIQYSWRERHTIINFKDLFDSPKGTMNTQLFDKFNVFLLDSIELHHRDLRILWIFLTDDGKWN